MADAVVPQPPRPFRYGPAKCLECQIELPTIESWAEHIEQHERMDLECRRLVIDQDHGGSTREATPQQWDTVWTPGRPHRRPLPG